MLSKKNLTLFLDRPETEISEARSKSSKIVKNGQKMGVLVSINFRKSEWKSPSKSIRIFSLTLIFNNF